MFEAKLDAASFADNGTKQSLIQALADNPDETLNEITKGYHRKSRWAIMIEVIRAIGYPRNAQALPWLVDHIDRNSPAWRETVEVVTTLDPKVIAPHLVHVLWDKGEHRQGWGYDVESICVLLSELDSSYAALCGPTIAYLLGQHFDPTELDPGFLLDVLAKVGVSSASYALPVLIDRLQIGSPEYVLEQVKSLIASYSEEARAPYSLVMNQTA